MPSDTLATRVIAVHQSPMNAQRWCLTLQCGHELWVTATRKPKTQTVKCPQRHGDEKLKP
jgi:hypothetical protein